MWSLPDINRLNARASARAKRLKREAARKRKPQCEIYGCTRRATDSTLWYDIFSADPKGVLHTCPEHCWADDPDLFACDACRRVVVDHYTHEHYQIVIGGVTLCLKCAAERYFAADSAWIDPKLVKEVIAVRGLLLFDQARGILNIAACRHVLGVNQPLPAGVVFYDNAEFDAENWHQISGDNLLDLIQGLEEPFCPVLDAGYQFAVSIGIYLRQKETV